MNQILEFDATSEFYRSQTRIATFILAACKEEIKLLSIAMILQPNIFGKLEGIPEILFEAAESGLRDMRKTAPKGNGVINEARPLKALYANTKNKDKKQQQKQLQQYVQEKDHAAQVAADVKGKKAAKEAALQETKNSRTRQTRAYVTDTGANSLT